MYKRLLLAKTLLKPEGILCVTIDNYEVHNLRHILDEIFADKEIIMTVIQHNFRGRAKSNFALTHEYILWVVPKGKESISRLKVYSDEIKRNLRRTGQNSRRKDAPTMFYGITVNRITLKIISCTEPIRDSEPLPVSLNKDNEIILPIDSTGIQRNWYYSSKRVLLESKTGDVFAKYIKGKIEIHYRQDGKLKRRKSVWTDTKFDSSTYGTEILTSLIGENNFPFPKSIYAVKECIESATQNKEAYILDFFAGSGTTGHSAMLLNKEDGGKRKFILCTNNENGIANEILYPRIKTVINGVENLKELTFIPSNVRYFKTNFVSKSSVSDDTRNSLVRKSTEMICVREDTFDKVLDKKEFKLYRNNNLVTGILFDLDELDRFKEELSKLKLSAHIYVFSLTNDTYASDFENLKIKNTLCPIPESILEVYRKLFKE